MNKTIRKPAASSIFLLLLCFVSAARADLTKQINGIISQPSQKKVDYGIRIIKADSGHSVYTHDSQKAMVPASNMKLIVTATALKYLGADYEYTTKVGLCGDTLVVVGSGDPLLGDRQTDAKYSRSAGWIFRDIEAALKNKGVSVIKDIIVDSTIFDDQRVHENWPVEELNRWYASEVSGLNYNCNCIDVTARNQNGRVNVFFEPQTAFIKLTNQVAAVKSGKHGIGAYRQAGKVNELIVKGRCKQQDGPFPVAIERPAAFFGFLLAEHLTEASIQVQGQLSEKPADTGSDFVLLYDCRTSIRDCLARCNKDSLQLAAEALVKTMAARANGGRGGSWAGGREVITQYLLSLGLKKEQFYIDDGSGLSKENRLSAEVVTGVLTDIYKSTHWTVYKDSLAVGGVDGTIDKYFAQKEYKGKVFGKTGYISGVKSFSGLCTTEKGDYIFSILANNANAHTRPAINDIVEALFDN